MPPRPPRRRSEPNAGPTIPDDRPVVGTTSSATAAAATPTAARPRKFTALLDSDTDTRYGRLLEQLRADVGPVATRQDGNGRSRAGYDLSRADLLRALLATAEDDPSVMADVATKVRSHYGAPS